MPLQFVATHQEFLGLSPKANNISAGAQVEFVGKVRNINHNKLVKFLVYEADVELAQNLFADLERQAREKYRVLNTFAVHRLCEVHVGEPAVLICVEAVHRHEALLAAQYLIDELKKTLPIWKKEVYEDNTSSWEQNHVCHFSVDEDTDMQMLTPVARALYQRGTTLNVMKEKSVLLIGAGGLGCPLSINLCALGIAHLSIVDGDVISSSNLARQFVFSPRDVGLSKVQKLTQFLLERFNVGVMPHEQFIAKHNLDQLSHGADLIIDATDCASTKTLLREYAYQNSRPIISASVHQQDGEVMSYVGGKGDACLSCHDRKTEMAEDSCADVGVLTHLCQLVSALACDRALSIMSGQMMAGAYMDIIDPILGIRSLNFDKDDQCRVCGKGKIFTDKPQLCQIQRLAK